MMSSSSVETLVLVYGAASAGNRGGPYVFLLIFWILPNDLRLARNLGWADLVNRSRAPQHNASFAARRVSRGGRPSRSGRMGGVV